MPLLLPKLNGLLCASNAVKKLTHSLVILFFQSFFTFPELNQVMHTTLLGAVFDRLDALPVPNQSTEGFQHTVHNLTDMYLSLDGIGRKKHSGFRRTVDVAVHYRLFHLQKEQMLRYLLNYFRHILGKELHQERERSRAVRWNVLIQNLHATFTYRVLLDYLIQL